MTGHIFISYSRVDRDYVDRLAEYLRSERVELWYDRYLRHGQRFDSVIQQRLRTSAAVVVVMTKEAADSEWVQNEIAFALDQDKDVYPLLLRDCEIPVGLQFVHYEDVQGGGMPGLAYIDALLGKVRAAGGGQTPSDHPVDRRPDRVGIDLGTVTSSVSFFNGATRWPVVVGDGAGATPTVVRRPARGDPLAGTAALIHGILHPRSSTVEAPIRHVLEKLRADVEVGTEGGRVTAATIATAPGLDGALITAAAAEAGIGEAQLLGPFAAAALAVRLDRPRGRHRALVVQMRDGHAAACVATTEPDRVEVTRGVSDGELGLRRWDERVADHLARSTEGSERWDETARLRVLVAAGRARKDLSTHDSGETFLPLVAPGTHLFRTVDRALFDSLTADLVSGIGELLERVTPAEPVDRVVLIADGSPDPAITALIRSRTGHHPESLTLSHPIAMAAAWWAAVSAGDIEGPTLTDLSA